MNRSPYYDPRLEAWYAEHLPPSAAHGDERNYKLDLKLLPPSNRRWWGRCFAASKFAYIMSGGLKGPLELHCAPRIIVPLLNGEPHETCHWFLRDKATREPIDYTARQFRRLCSVDDVHAKGRRADYGWKFFHRDASKRMWLEVVPSLSLMALYEKWLQTGQPANADFEIYRRYCQEHCAAQPLNRSKRPLQKQS